MLHGPRYWCLRYWCRDRGVSGTDRWRRVTPMGQLVRDQGEELLEWGVSPASVCRDVCGLFSLCCH